MTDVILEPVEEWMKTEDSIQKNILHNHLWHRPEKIFIAVKLVLC